MYKCTCKYCGKEFDSRYKDVQVCKECKNRPCEICGKPFVHEWPYDQHCCSKACREVFLKDPERNKILNEQRKATIQAKYGVDNVAQLGEVKEKIQRSKIDSENYFIEKQAAVASKVVIPIIRKCNICGKEFVAKGSQTTCEGPHFKKCVVCGKEFQYFHLFNKRQTCSKECQVNLRKQTIASTRHICSYCGKEFYSNSNSAKYCQGPHYTNCIICGNQFSIDFTQSGFTVETMPRTCSDQCTAKLRQQTNLDRYGYASPHQRLESRQYFHDKAIATSDQRKQTVYEKYGTNNVSQYSEIRSKIASTVASDKNQAKMRSTMQERYGVDYAMQSPNLAAKHRAAKSNIFTCDGTRVDSSWEQHFYNFLMRNNIPFEYNTQTIPYEYNGTNHILHVDFKVNDMLFEVKGDHLLEGVGDGIPIDVKIGLYKKYHIILICGSNVNNIFGKPDSAESNGLKYLDKCPEPLIGVDISLFTNPQFPFATDRPPCFYKVKVDGGQSSLEAFFDEKIRWKMILNRINYSGGFITAKSVLNAMNVTRTCKPPSWFSKTLAKQIITDYCTSDTIVDPFAGWGMRHDAAIELHRYYVGSDYNPELVEWHQKHSRSITLADANKFTYQGECSVFICPPYSDPKTGRCFEDYSFEGFDSSAKALSQCDWLKIVMHNVPNASEYVMVCKIIDEGWQPYVVEELTNQSHFGTNSEYIIVVKQNQKESLLSKSL